MLLFIVFTLLLCLWISYEINKNNKKGADASEEFWKREYEAHFVRPTDISQLDYIQVPLDTLPFQSNQEDLELSACEAKLRSLSEKKLYNLSGLTNTDIRYQYGARNFDTLSVCDQNFLLFIRELDRWGHLLYERKQKNEARQVLEYAISIHSDIKKTYLLLAKIYHETGENEKIDALIQQASGLTTLLKDSLLESLENIRNT